MTTPSYTPAYKQAPNSSSNTQYAISPPPGSIMAYFGGTNTAGSNDPDGWVICDGTARTNSDSRFNYLANTLGIGSISGTNYIPIDLRGAFLRGAQRGSTSTYGACAATVGSSQDHATQTHSHLITDPGHGHLLNDYIDDGNNLGAGTATYYGWPIPHDHDSVNPWNGGINNVASNKTGIIINNSTTYTNDTETRPYNYAVNWIMKI